MTVFYDEGDFSDWADFSPKELLNEAARAAVKACGFDWEVQLSVSLVDEDEIQEANRLYRGKDAPTDVLSFPMVEFELKEEKPYPIPESEDFDPDSGELLLGDIVLCVPRVISQATEYGHSVKREYAFLIVHSLLHLMGYDHMDSDERAAMEDMQRKILDTMGISR